MTWTSETRETAKHLWLEGVSGGDIARAVHKTRNAVIGMVYRSGIRRGEAAMMMVLADRRKPKPKTNASNHKRSVKRARTADGKLAPLKIADAQAVLGSGPIPLLKAGYGTGRCAVIVAGEGADSLVCGLPVCERGAVYRLCEQHAQTCLQPSREVA